MLSSVYCISVKEILKTYFYFHLLIIPIFSGTFSKQLYSNSSNNYHTCTFFNIKPVSFHYHSIYHLYSLFKINSLIFLCIIGITLYLHFDCLVAFVSKYTLLTVDFLYIFVILHKYLDIFFNCIFATLFEILCQLSNIAFNLTSVK